jgi:DNA ligase-1
MKQFAELYFQLDGTTKTNAKVGALQNYLSSAPPADAAWAVYFLRGGKLRAPIPTRVLCDMAAEAAGIPGWLFAECYDSVGDLAETAALLIPVSSTKPDDDQNLDAWITQRLVPLRAMEPADQRETLIESWRRLSPKERFVWNKLITGSFRVGVSEGLVTKAIAAATGMEGPVIAHRLAGAWEPSAAAWERLTAKDPGDTALSQPYPFCLAHALDKPPENLGEIHQWVVEYKWDGIRAQVIKRQGSVFIWSRGGEPLEDRFPEIVAMAAALPDGTVIDGELLAWREQALPFAELQHRITRKKPSKKILESIPARLLAFDLLEFEGRDLRSEPLVERLRRLRELPLDFFPKLDPVDWHAAAELRASARTLLAEGLMLKSCNSPYGTGRERGIWWKWKIDPYAVDAVLVYAQRGHGRRASLYTDYTFALWDGDALVPFAKAYSGLTDAEIREVDAFIRRNTLEKFGPVCTVRPELVFEIAFEGIQQSNRHKSGVAVRFPRIARWRTDKTAAEADTIDAVKNLFPGHPASGQ